MNRGLLLVGAAALVGAFMKNSVADAIVPKTGDFYRYDDLFQRAARTYQIGNWLWIKAIAWNESSVGAASSVKRGLASPTDREGSKSSDGLSWGIMQVTETTARDLRPGTTYVDLNNPAISIDLGAKYLSQMLARYRGDLNRAVRAYNQGPGNEDKRKPYADEYLKRFLAHFDQLLKIHA